MVAEASLYATELRHAGGIDTDAMVLVGPTSYANDGIISVDYFSQNLTIDSYVDRIIAVSAYTPVLIIDDTDTGIWQNRFSDAITAGADITVDYLLDEGIYNNHTAIDDLPAVRDLVTDWLTEKGLW